MSQNSISLKRQNLDAVILDLDGVITQTARIHAKAWKKMFDEYNDMRRQKGESTYKTFDIKEDYQRYIDGKPRYDGVASFLESKGIELPFGDPTDAPDRETICGLGNRKNKSFLDIIKTEGADIYEDAVQRIIEWRNMGLKTAVVSSSKNCKTIIETAKISHLFDIRVDGVTAAELNLNGKPAPDIFLYAASELQVDPSRAIVVEDAISGVQAGRAGNFRHVVGVAREGQKEELRQNGADMVVQHLGELIIENSPEDNRETTFELPNALEQQEDIFKKITEKKGAIFLDYDGTLSPIVNRPEDAKLTPEMRETLLKLSTLCTVAIVSGRDRADVKQLVGLEELIYAGSHGFDISGPRDMRMEHEYGVKCLPALDKAEQQLKKTLNTLAGVQVERKRFSVAVHYRNANEQVLPLIEEEVEKILKSENTLQKGLGKKIIELQPKIEWDKGKAVLWLLKKLNLDEDDVMPFYLGDDLTDENAFKALSDRGIGILVGHHGEPTNAKYQLENVQQVRQLLNRFIDNLEDRAG